jgi:DNA-binding transcriptional ArsR family regulator
MHSAPDMVFRTLADPTRRAIFERLVRDGEQTVRALTDHSGVSQPAVSKHLAVLKHAGLVRDRHEGRQTHYSADTNAFACDRTRDAASAAKDLARRAQDLSAPAK